MAPLTGKTVPELGVETPPIVDADQFVVYRAGSPPLKSTTAATLAAYMRTKVGEGGGFIYLSDYLNGQPVGDAFRQAIAQAVTDGKWVLVPAGEYIVTGNYNSEGILGLDGAGTVGLVCRDGEAVLKLPLTAGTGLITTTLNSQTVTGNGAALFTSALVGKNLQNAAGEYIGKVDTVESPTSLTLVDPAWREISTPGAWSYSSEARAFITQTDGANFYVENIEFDCAAITSNFGHKAVAGGFYEGTAVRYRYKPFRFLDDGATSAPAIASWNIDKIEVIDAQGHGVTGGADATTADMGSGYIGMVDCVNCTKSALNISVLRSTGHLYIGRVSGDWRRWREEGMPYPTQYATLRLGNGAANITVGYVWGQGMFRLIRMTDPDNCNVLGYGFRDILGPVILFNSKDQVSVNSGVGIGFGIGPNRGNGRPAPGDEDGESISNPNEEAVVIAEGVGYGFGPATFSSDEYIPGLGTIAATSGNASVVNKDDVFRGQDINCFDDLNVGDFLFNTSEQLLGQVTAISLKSYWSNAGSTVPIGTAGTSTVSVPLGGTTLVKAGGTSFVTQGVASGDIILNSLGNVVGTVTGTVLADALTFEEGAAIEMPLGSAWYHAGGISSAVNATQTATLSGGSLQTVSAGSDYYQRTPDSYFYTDGGGLATVSGTAMTIPAPVADLGGTITTLTSSKQVEGQGTDFVNQYVVGQHLFTTGDVSIGQIASFGRRVNGAIVDKDTYLQLVNNAAQAITIANFKYGYNFNDVLAVGDAIFKTDDTLIGEIATINNAQSITLAATALTTITGANYQFGRWKKTARGIEIAETAVNSNINLDSFWCQGAVAQYRLQQPLGIRPHNENTITLTQLATISASGRRGQRWYISDLTPPGWVTSDNSAWARDDYNALQSSSTTTGFTLSYLSNGPVLRLTGNVGAGVTATITLPTAGSAGLPNGATYTIFSATSNAGTWEISTGSVLTRLRTGQWATVIHDSTGTPVWRLVATGNHGDRIPKITRGSGTPEASVLGSVGDLYLQLNAAAGQIIWVKRTGDGTNTGWGNLGSKLLLDLTTTTALTSSQVNQTVVVDATSGAVSITTPAAGTLENGTWVTIKKNDTSTNRVTCLINGSATERAWLRTQHDEVTFVIRAGAWEVLSYSIAPFESMATSSGTWTKPPLLSRLVATLVSGGSGGGSGRRGAAGTVRCGGNGGNGATVLTMFRAASVLPASATYIVGAGGAGGPAITVDDTNGSVGATGGDTSFGAAVTDAWYARALSTAGGSGGTAAGATQATPAQGGSYTAGTGASQSSTGGAGATASATYAYGGGSGGGITTGNVYSAGGNGRANGGGTNAAGTAGGAGTPGGAGAAGAVAAGVLSAIPSGAGGGSGEGGGDGGAGGQYGGAGGGGGASLNGTNSGAGGAGANGVICFIEEF